MSEPVPKLLCVSLNPAIDRRITLPQLRVGEVNRASSADPVAGGKAAHVAYAAKRLGAAVRWLAFVGGAEGDACVAGIEARGIHAVPVAVAGRTRMTLELIDASAKQITEVLEPGPRISLEERGKLLEVFAGEIEQTKFVVLSGSLPMGVPESFYAELVEKAKHAGCTVFLDTSGPALREALAAHPDLIKPNQSEAEAIVSHLVRNQEEAFAAAQQLRSLGAESVIISRGAGGAIVVAENEAWWATPPKVEAISTVGSGDSFLAGWVFATAQGLPLEDRLRLAVACGTANCVAASPGEIVRADVERIAAQVVVKSRAAQK